MRRDQGPAAVFSGAFDTKFLLSSDRGCGNGISVCFYTFPYFEYPDEGQDSWFAAKTSIFLCAYWNSDFAVGSQEWDFLFYRHSCDMKGVIQGGAVERSRGNGGIYTFARPYGV